MRYLPGLRFFHMRFSEADRDFVFQHSSRVAAALGSSAPVLSSFQIKSPIFLIIPYLTELFNEIFARFKIFSYAFFRGGEAKSQTPPLVNNLLPLGVFVIIVIIIDKAHKSVTKSPLRQHWAGKFIDCLHFSVGAFGLRPCCIKGQFLRVILAVFEADEALARAGGMDNTGPLIRFERGQKSLIRCLIVGKKRYGHFTPPFHRRRISE